ncbi:MULTISPECIES: radical SAM protein [unclassified Methanoregula]|uniref:radical SAM protein n=1 Tax=unclassified Methanoregula TaxID=2649730 RepID=UPI0009D0E987|nr:MULTISPECIES: radical SAM protein [unclassified Methanoregula]OPX65259.1 MAG: Radical SAM superfamily protein [Methanoregula sp. PtaB.Bin085]OPY32168.1 MAG: Radical SAM superfamily protein [Methanoregula sp. PtaU1.Bin006]
MEPDEFRPAYLTLHASGELDERADRAEDLLKACTVCPRRCGVNRFAGEQGFCRTGLLPVVSSYGPHFGEEPPLVGHGGSGTIFITHCNLACTFCQNADISQEGRGGEIPLEKFAEMMLRLQKGGCVNINVVTPTHIVPQLIRSIGIAAGRGLSLPVVYNSGGYESMDTLRLLDGIIDIYMPDAKYGSNRIAEALSGAAGYVDVMRDALREMHRQVGDLVITGGIARHGLLVRHLVLPDNLAGSDSVLPWIAENLSQDTYVNIMDQYHPAHRVIDNPENRFPSLRRSITAIEYRQAVRIAQRAGLHRGFPG